jgi:hypothetical protein
VSRQPLWLGSGSKPPPAVLPLSNAELPRSRISAMPARRANEAKARKCIYRLCRTELSLRSHPAPGRMGSVSAP